MRVDRPAVTPLGYDHINPLPERKLSIAGAGDVIKQAHPESRERFVIKILQAMMRGEGADFFPHSFQCLRRRHLLQITQRHRDVGGVAKIGRRNGDILKCLHQDRDFPVAVKPLCLQTGPAYGLNRPQTKSRMIAPITDMMNPAA